MPFMTYMTVIVLWHNHISHSTKTVNMSVKRSVRTSVTELISWADGLANGGVGIKSTLKREPSLTNGRQSAALGTILSVPANHGRGDREMRANERGREKLTIRETNVASRCIIQLS